MQLHLLFAADVVSTFSLKLPKQLLVFLVRGRYGGLAFCLLVRLVLARRHLGLGRGPDHLELALKILDSRGRGFLEYSLLFGGVVLPPLAASLFLARPIFSRASVDIDRSHIRHGGSHILRLVLLILREVYLYQLLINLQGLVVLRPALPRC